MNEYYPGIEVTETTTKVIDVALKTPEGKDAAVVALYGAIFLALAFGVVALVKYATKEDDA